MDNSILNSDEVSNLVVLIQEGYRSTKKGVRNFVEPAVGTLIRVKSKTHNIVFGRRGSGKSSLLRKAAADLTVDRRPIAYVDLETFKGHSYPDVLLSVLIQTFREFEKWLRTAAINPANKTSFWKNLFDLAPQKYPSIRDFEVQVTKRLVYFESAEHDPDPSLLNPISWDAVKEYFIKQAKEIEQGWL